MFPLIPVNHGFSTACAAVPRTRACGCAEGTGATGVGSPAPFALPISGISIGNSSPDLSVLVKQTNLTLCVLSQAGAALGQEPAYFIWSFLVLCHTEVRGRQASCCMGMLHFQVNPFLRSTGHCNPWQVISVVLEAAARVGDSQRSPLFQCASMPFAFSSGGLSGQALGASPSGRVCPSAGALQARSLSLAGCVPAIAHD